MNQEIFKALLIVSLLITGSWGIGSVMTARLKIKIKLAEKLIFSLLLGLAVNSLFVYFFGLVHLLYFGVILIVLIIENLFSIKRLKINLPYLKNHLLARRKKNFQRFDLIEKMILFLLGLTLIIYLINTLAPAIKFDDLWYHLTETKLYLAEHRIRAFFPPSQLGQSSITPRLIDLLYVFPLAFFPHSSIGPKLIHFLFGLLSLGGIYLISRFLFNRRTGLIATLMFATLPIFGWLNQTAYIDLGVTAYVSATLYFYLRFKSHPTNSTGLATALFLGLALSTKLWMLGFWFILLLDAVWQRYPVKKIMLIFGYSLLLLMPWLIEAYLWSGNPVYPLFSWKDQSDFLGGAPSIQVWLLKIYWLKLLPTLKSAILYSLPWLTLLPLIFWNIQSKFRFKLWLLILGGAFLLIWAVIPWRDDRFLLPFSIPLIILAANGLEEIISHQKILAFGLIPILGLLFFLLIAPLHRALFYLPVVSGKITAESFLAEKVGKNIWGCYDQDGKIKKIISNQPAKTLAFCHNLFYLDFPFSDGFDVLSRLDYRSGQELINLLQKNDYRYLLFKLPVYPENAFLNQIKVKIPENWFANHFKLIYTNQAGGLKFYEIRF